MSIKKIVVTGGAGFIGSNLVDALVVKGYKVHVIDNFAGGRNESKFNKSATYHEKDIRNIDDIKPIINGAEFVFHLAALPRVQYSIENPKETNEVNVEGTLNVLIAAKEGGVKKVVYSASSSAYGDQAVMPLREEMEAHPKSPYGLQKYLGELYMRLWSEVYEVPTVSLRYFNVYGPGQSSEGAYALVIAKFLKQRAEGKAMTITGDGKQTRDFTHVRDVVAANILAAENPEIRNGEVFNIGSGKNYSVNEIAKIIGGEVQYIPARMEPKDTLADNSKARNVLGWIPKEDLEQAIKELL